MKNTTNKDVILPFTDDIYDSIEADEETIHDFDEAIKNTNNPIVKHSLEKSKENFDIESKWEDAQFIWEEQLGFIDSQTNKIQNPITHASIGRWDGRREHDEQTEEVYTIKEAVMHMTGCDDVEVYIENNDVILHGVHHDGSNYYVWGKKQGKKIKKLLDAE